MEPLPVPSEIIVVLGRIPVPVIVWPTARVPDVKAVTFRELVVITPVTIAALPEAIDPVNVAVFLVTDTGSLNLTEIGRVWSG